MTHPIPIDTVKDRIKRGWTRERAMNTPSGPTSPTRIHYITAKGKTQNLAQWARELGISAACLRMRIRNGWTEREAVSCPLQRHRYLTFKGKTLLVSQWAKKKGMRVAALRYRLKAGWSVDAALNVPIHRRKSE